MNATEYTGLSVAGIRTGLLSGSFTAREVAEAALAQVVASEPRIHAFIQQTPEACLQAAEAVDKAVAAGAGESLPPLAGVPIAFKDNMNLVGTHTTCASRMLEEYVSPYTATCVERAIGSGGLPLGKLNMDEFAFGSSTETSAFGCTHNPWDLGRVPGGSSGGSAAAVAAGMATVTLGSDPGGSIRQPAAFCGVVGMKPTYGVVSRYGVVAFGSSLDQVGPFGRSVADVAATLDAIAGRDVRDCTSQELALSLGAGTGGAAAGVSATSFSQASMLGAEGLTVGVVPAYLEAAGLEPAIADALKGAIARLEGLGARTVEVELPHADAALSAYYVIGPCEAFSNLSRFDSVRYGHREPGAPDLGEQYERSRAAGFGPEAVRRIMLGSYLLSSGVYDTYYYPAQQVRTLITRDYQQAFEHCDVLLTPVCPRAAFKFGEVADPTSMYLNDLFTIPINIAGNGGLSLPVGYATANGEYTDKYVAGGLPVGVQVIGPQFGDANILRLAAALEATYEHVSTLAPKAGEAPQPVTPGLTRGLAGETQQTGEMRHGGPQDGCSPKAGEAA
jgi:aspartyl-tRNA(Asn)/glutamyl-tRNA(Gln) amidotransferase subunit A